MAAALVEAPSVCYRCVSEFPMLCRTMSDESQHITAVQTHDFANLSNVVARVSN
jgi:hypothetical protein